MAAGDGLALFRPMVGDNDDDEEDFHGFTMEQITKDEESDIDLALVVQDHFLESERESVGLSSSDSSESCEAVSDVELLLPQTQKRRKRRKKTVRQKKSRVETNWSATTKPVEIKHTFQQEDQLPDPLPDDATPPDFFGQFITDSFSVKLAAQTNKYTSQKPDEYWKETDAAEMKLFFFTSISCLVFTTCLLLTCTSQQIPCCECLKLLT